MEIEQWLGKDNQIGIDIWHKKYQFNGETLDQFFDRVSGGVEELKNVIINKEFLPGGRILAGRGVEKNGRKVTTSNCYVVSRPDDNIESIFECAQKMARTYSYGGGCGTDLSKLAPRGAIVRNAAKTTSGPLPFMDLFSTTTDVIGQSGRRGALMLTLSCEHPDIEEFIDVKKNLNKVTKANISVRFTKRFLEAAIENKELEVSFTREETGEKITKMLNPRKLLEKMAQNNWEMGEPGALFWDKVLEWNMNSNNPEYVITSTNPCGEQPLPEGGSCLLGSINLNAFVKDGQFNVNRFKEVIHIAVRGMNKVLDESIELHPLKEQRDCARDWRNCGLGIMGLADCLINMGITYGSQQSIQFCDIIGRILIEEAIQESADLAVKDGMFPKCKPELMLETPFLRNVLNEEKHAKLIEQIKISGLRNCALLTIAPTGTLSTMLGISGGIEPIFANSYTRKTESLNEGGETYYKIYTPIVDAYMKAHDLKEEEELPEFFIIAGQLEPHNRVVMQAVWQKYIDAAISSTVNLAEEATPQDIYNIYLAAYETGCKGITVFRNNCFRTGILTTEKKEEKPVNTEPGRGEILTVDDTLIGLKRKLMTGCGSMYCCPYYTTEGEMREIFLSKGSSGVCLSFMTALGRLISLCLRGGISQEAITDQLLSIPSCPSYVSRAAVNKDTSKGKNCPSAIAYALIEMAKQIKDVSTTNDNKPKIKAEPILPQEDNKRICPICGNELVPTNGCWSCTCGYSKCEG